VKPTRADQPCGPTVARTFVSCTGATAPVSARTTTSIAGSTASTVPTTSLGEGSVAPASGLAIDRLGAIASTGRNGAVP
jgi:hypothetical protein